MKVLIPTMGTRGDVQPYIALATRLNASGYEVTIATHPCWKDLIENYNINFVPIGPDVDIEYETAKIRGNSKNWMLGFIRTMKFVFKIIEESTFEIKKLCLNADLVVASHSNIGATEAEASGIPFISVTLQPDIIPKKLGNKSKVKAFLNSIVGTFVNPFMVRPYNKLRKVHGLKKISSFDELLSPILNIVPISPLVYPSNEFWEGKNKIVGYWFLDEVKEFCPSEELSNFLKSGPAPIIISLGAMGFESEEEKAKLDILVNSVNEVKMRAIIQGFNKTLESYKLEENILAVGSIPHTWLFKYGYCIIHHGGMSTTATAILSGVPAIVIPHITDQFYWAKRVYELNLGPKPIPSKDLSKDILVNAINSVKNNYEQFSNSSIQLANKLQTENGLDKTVELISNILGIQDI
ncbi:glycosyltransferase [Clostridium sp. MSJ-11]|uniref:Glycosyltransferase n=1 Tax=Clostridium mobile TaxID=2841512 RepID=A0ABS6EG71_9CLOT|nr:glycosyltransferase [Clostridium mobile]MBU5483399.1 glycosyltransferase [Clostridium mobile]